MTPPSGAVRPVVSTEDEPVWYVMTSSHQTVEDRMNRYLYANGSELLTEQYSGGLDPKEAAETFLWRLEDAGDGLVLSCQCGRRAAG